MERKLATVLFVDLVDSTALVTGADPEVVRRRVQTFFDRVSHCVTTHGGIVEKFAGDAVMAAFGIPQGHEDDAERGVRAGLAILDAVEELELQARVGVEWGEVVADDAEATFATGEAVTLAARLEQAAEPGQLLLGPGAHRLTLGRVEVEDLGPIEMKGLAAPVWTWRGPCRRSRRRSSAARPSSTCSRTPTSARCATAAPTCSRSTARREWGRAGSRGSSRARSRARPFCPAAASRTARASPTGRSPRWSSARPALRTTTRWTSRSKSCGPSARTRPWPTCLASHRACSRPSSPRRARKRSPGQRAK